MATDCFDRIVRALVLTPSRRGAARLLTAGVLAAVGGGDAAGRSRRCQPKCKVCQRCRDGRCKARPRDGRCAGPCDICLGGKCRTKATGAPCADGKVCEGGSCVDERCGNGGPCRVFVAEEGYDGAMTRIGDPPGATGLAAADAHCQRLADAAGLGGTFMAWLSAGGSSPATRFTNLEAAAPYLLVSNAGDAGNPAPKVANNSVDLFGCVGGCIQHAINRTADGTVLGGSTGVWTGTSTDGTAAADTCGGWTGAGTGGIGLTSEVDADWTDTQSPTSCATPFDLYCFEQA